MATVSGAVNEKIFSVKGWGGLNEAPDGDTRLKLGEASKMINWKITRDGNLKRRPGTDFIAGLCQDYELRYATLPTDLFAVDETAQYPIYNVASADFPSPGKVTLTGSGSGVINGTLISETATIRNGMLTFPPEAQATISDGVLTISNAPQAMTISQLQTALDGLSSGNYLYYYHDELPYALNKESLYMRYGELWLRGYLVESGPVLGEGDSDRIRGLWSGLVHGKQMLLAACNGKLWSLYDADADEMTRTPVIDIVTDGPVSFFPFGGNVYILNGHEYYVYDGEDCDPVVGYIPTVYKQVGPIIPGTDDPASGEPTGEYVNLLTPYRKVWLSPDGDNATFPLPEQNITWDTSCYVKNLGTETVVPATAYSVDTTKGQITFIDEHDDPDPPDKGVNTYEVQYCVETEVDYKAQVTGNRFAELFSGPTDNMVFIYGDGTNRALYSGMDEDGMPRVDYFPDQYSVDVGDSNTPLTAMIRHYGDLVCYKTDSTWAITQGSMELATGDNTISLYCTPVNRAVGNVAPGQVRLVDNNPVTCSERELYQWVNSSYYTSNLSRDERQAKRISDRIQSSIKEIDLTKACMWDDNDGQEWYLSENKVTLVWNYVTDTWYRYEGIDAVCMCNFRGEVIYGTSNGLVARITYDVRGDLGHPIRAEWISGAIDFGAANMRKYSSAMWVGLKPEDGTSVDVCVMTDRKNTFKEKVVSSEKAKVPGEPFTVKTKLKAKKFVFYRLLLTVEEKQPAVTVTDIEFRVRQTGYAK